MSPPSSSKRGGATPDPGDIARRLDEAAAHFSAGRLEAAAQVYRQVERAMPDDVRATFSLAMIDLHQGRLARAGSRLEAVVARQPALVSAQHNLGAVRQQLGDWPGAADAYGAALALRPEAAETRAALATMLAILGRTQAAIDAHRYLAQDPARWPAALTRIALLDPGAIDDADLAQMQAATRDPRLDGETRIGLPFALGEVLEHRGRPAEAFEAWSIGNRRKRESLDGVSAPDRVAAANAAAIAHVKGRFRPAVVAQQAGRAGRSEAPIFIVGLPRSGSTLAEQILASHPAVQSLGETGVLPNLLLRGYPDSAAGFRDLAGRYLSELRRHGWDGASRFVDKTLENYLHVGAIALMFPRAAILQMVRDPMDTGFACYRQLFLSGNETLYDLADIGAEYQRYRDVMDHWSAVLPGRSTAVSYETLVGDPQVAIPALVVEAAGLSWDEACLRFHERDAAVRTASATQVRRPIHNASVARWRRHAADLAPLAQALGPYGPS